jgi:hypothetical protein
MEGLRHADIQISVQKVMSVGLALQFCILKIPGSNPSQDTVASVEVFCVFYSATPKKCQNRSSNLVKVTFLHTALIHSLPAIVSFDV